ncbi:hypothetical protein LJC74_09350 [Eubacteriales bacterium OttesenSCG-928-A19]|nr:hypothetical protein [Eubacteriales bacterium OttesenSCG-928-A19]
MKKTVWIALLCVACLCAALPAPAMEADDLLRAMEEANRAGNRLEGHSAMVMTDTRHDLIGEDGAPYVFTTAYIQEDGAWSYYQQDSQLYGSAVYPDAAYITYDGLPRAVLYADTDVLAMVYESLLMETRIFAYTEDEKAVSQAEEDGALVLTTELAVADADVTRRAVYRMDPETYIIQGIEEYAIDPDGTETLLRTVEVLYDDVDFTPREQVLRPAADVPTRTLTITVDAGTDAAKTYTFTIPSTHGFVFGDIEDMQYELFADEALETPYQGLAEPPFPDAVIYMRKR